MEDLSTRWDASSLKVFCVRDYGASPSASESANNTAIAAAVAAAVAAGGGVVYFPDAIPISATITCPNLSVRFEFGPGGAISLGSNAIAAFTIPNGLSAVRRYDFIHPSIYGDGVTNQNAIKYSDANGRGEVYLHNPKIDQITKPFNVTAYDLSYTNTGSIYIQGGHVFQPATPGTYTLITAPAVAGTFGAPFVIVFQDCMIDNLPVSGLAWTYDADLDIVIRGGKCAYLVLAGNNASNGLEMDGPWEIGAGSAATYVHHGACTVFCNDQLDGIVLWNMALRANWKLSKYSNIKLGVRSKIIVNCIQMVIEDVRDHLSSLGDAPDYRIDVLAGADNCLINGGLLTKASTALIRCAAQKAKIIGLTFITTAGEKTVTEAGAADGTQIGRCLGLASGAGVTLIGDNSFIEDERVFEGRVQRDSATQVSLRRFNGRGVCVNGEMVGIPSGGMVRAQSDNRIDGTGGDAGAALAVNTLYYVYISNAQASFSPSSIRLSTVAPSDLRGVKYLGTSGNAANWRFCGWVRTIDNGGTPNFADSATQRLVVNYYNRLDVEIGPVCPGYNDNNTVTSSNRVEAGAGNWAKSNGGTGTTTQFISNGEDAIQIDFQATAKETPGQTCGIGVAIDGLDPVVAAFFGAIVNDFEQLHGSRKVLIAAGYHTLDMVDACDSAGTLTIWWDFVRLGAAADPKVSCYSAMIRA